HQSRLAHRLFPSKRDSLLHRMGCREAGSAARQIVTWARARMLTAGRRRRIRIGPIRRPVPGAWVEDGLGRELKTSGVPDSAEEARPKTFMTCATDLPGLDQDDVAVAVDPDRLDVLHMPRGRAFVPVRPTRTRIEMRLPGGERLPQRQLVHPGHHQ